MKFVSFTIGAMALGLLAGCASPPRPVWDNATNPQGSESIVILKVTPPDSIVQLGAGVVTGESFVRSDDLGAPVVFYHHTNDGYAFVTLLRGTTLALEYAMLPPGILPETAKRDRRYCNSMRTLAFDVPPGKVVSIDLTLSSTMDAEGRTMKVDASNDTTTARQRLRARASNITAPVEPATYRSVVADVACPIDRVVIPMIIFR